MKLWLVLAMTEDSMGTLDAAVVIAETEERARYGAAVFDDRHLDSAYSTCKELTTDAYDGDPGVVVSGFSMKAWWRE